MYGKLTALALLAVAAFAQAPEPEAPAAEDWTDLATPDEFDDDFANNIDTVSLALWDDSENVADYIDSGDATGWVFGINIAFLDAPADDDYTVVGTFIEGEDNAWGITAGPGLDV